jgi:hypothetical protein
LAQETPPEKRLALIVDSYLTSLHRDNPGHSCAIASAPICADRYYFMSPLVSILIPCYNARPWIAQCIQSAIDQTYPHKEIVVFDDGSTDGSLDVIRDFSDRIRLDDVCPSLTE